MLLTSRSDIGSLLNLSIDFIPETNRNRSGRPIAPTHITVHNSSNANPGAHARFVKNRGFYELSSGGRNYVSWHYTNDVQVIKHLPVNERAIHAGRRNGTSIGIEICMHAEIDQAAANLRAQRLMAVLMHDLKIPASQIQSRKHWINKPCSTFLLDSFSSFRNAREEIRSSMEMDADEFEGAPLTAEEIEAVLRPSVEAETEAETSPEDDHKDEHKNIAAEVEGFID